LLHGGLAPVAGGAQDARGEGRGLHARARASVQPAAAPAARRFRRRHGPRAEGRRPANPGFARDLAGARRTLPRSPAVPSRSRAQSQRRAGGALGGRATAARSSADRSLRGGTKSVAAPLGSRTAVAAGPRAQRLVERTDRLLLRAN